MDSLKSFVDKKEKIHTQDATTAQPIDLTNLVGNFLEVIDSEQLSR